ncbi:hypothetical protein M431DRAFT_491142 [Trichoderma harzianum CBS 226.95]|jgi:hypothetical protein|uniref:Uncharacterized protein n=1 Tax=Trichoderma harzianum CBS 226.95 TaxID=983964 RepID=A0A2T4AR73_TRIHA|nr:hypothetical protein M431DRAFT_491142 [Trichoderma harzianum CBS 226.95]PTB59540.1 hypothetical protein M431DRAFT_491142 [Trichoderma harzianum CBS 226.95]
MIQSICLGNISLRNARHETNDFRDRHSPGHVAWPFDDMKPAHSQVRRCIALQTISQFFSHEAKVEPRCLLSQDLSILAWRGTSGCSINITSGPRRHMTPKWAVQRRVDGILRFAMSPTACCCCLLLPQGQSDSSTPLQPANAVRRRIRGYAASYIDDGGGKRYRLPAKSCG